MKKIVGILAAAAVLATSVFAVDVAASAKLSSDLFNFNTKTNAVKVFDKISMANEVDTLKFGVTTDNAGAFFRIRQQEKGEVTQMNIWFKPADNLKLSFLENGRSLESDKIHWWDYYKKVNVGAGYGAEFTADALSVALNIVPTFATVAGSGSNPVFGAIGAKVAYGADFGNIAAIVNFRDNFKGIDIGASYQNNFSGLNLVINGGVYLDDGFSGAQGLVFAGYNVDELSLSALSNIYYRSDAKKAADKVDGNLEVAAVAKIGYQLEGLKITGFFDCDNLLFKTFARNWTPNDTAAMKFGVDFEGSVGIASWKIEPYYNVYADTAAVAFETSVNF
jgi:hypothetical protein